MNRLGRAAVMLAVATVMSRLLWSGEFGWFVQQSMKLPLTAATVVLAVMGAYEAVAGTIEERRDHTATRRSAGPLVGWLLVLPILVLASVAPTALGAAAADRVEPYTPPRSPFRFDELDTSSQPVELPVNEFVRRAVWGDKRVLEGVTVRLEGLVVNDPEVTDGFVLTRFLVSCCAADGIPQQIIVHGTGPELANDTWVVVDLVWRPPEVPFQDTPFPWIPEADAAAVEVVPNPPTDPYETLW